jgi:opacity protein-like surface antigen
MSKCITVLGMAVVVIALPANAADVLQRHPAPHAAQPLPPAPVGMTWSGFYIGGNLGAAFNPDDLSIKDLSEEQDLSLRFSNDTDLIGGVHAGYNWQTGPWVLASKAMLTLLTTSTFWLVLAVALAGASAIGCSMVRAALLS